MDELSELELEAVRKLSQLGDGIRIGRADQADIMGHFWGDRKALSRIANHVEWSETWCRKLAGAGAVKQAGFWDGKMHSIEWAYQLSLFRQAQWKQMFDIAAMGDLSSGNLKNLRIIDEKLRQAGKCLVLEDV